MKNFRFSFLLTLLFLILFSCDKDDDSFELKPENIGTVEDIDGNIYKTVKIGDQWWTAQNFRVTHYNNGSNISHITDNEEWSNATTGAYCWLDNNDHPADFEGALYNWYAINTGKLCPSGWHVATEDDWKKLLIFLESEGFDRNNAGHVLKANTSNWPSNSEGNNRYGFEAYSTTWRFGNETGEENGSFEESWTYASFWTSTPKEENRALSYYLHGGSSVEIGHRMITRGMSVRIVKD